MDGNEDHVAVLVGEFNHFLHAAHVVTHPHQASENAHSVVYMDYVIPYVESAQIVESKLLALVNCAPEAHSVESVEYLVIGVAANLVLGVDEAVVDVLPLNELGDEASVLDEDGAHPFQLRLLLAVNVHFVTVLHPGAYVRGQKLEILVENRLRGYGETYLFVPGIGHRGIDVHFPES